MNENPDVIHENVRRHYAKQITDSSCCSDSCCNTESNLYPEELLATLPKGESAVSYGCGDPITLAALQPGETVLDLGSGAGLDCFLAARQVGESGHVIGVDMTPEMIERATISARRLNLTNVEFRQGYLEELPVEANTVDVAISNCVINLAPDKNKVFREVFRALKPGAKIAVSDVVTDGTLPNDVKESMTAWAGCMAGALDIQEYKAELEAAGFTDIEIAPTYFDDATIEEATHEMGDKVDLKVFSREQIAKTVFSARITARKP